MIEAGILDEDEKVQLIDGMLVAMAPQGQPHAFAIMRLTRLLASDITTVPRGRSEGASCNAIY
jgi:hypothetical protein